MEHALDQWLDNPYFASIAFFSVAIVALIIFLYCFEFAVRYKTWDEIKNGNLAVAMATGGKIFGICNLFRFSIESGDSLYQSILWAALGFVLLLVAYFLFEFFTPVFRIDDELKRDNRAVGFIAMMISISLSYVIGAAVLS